MLYAEEIKRGMRKLNTGQLMDINLRVLDMRAYGRCVLGQVFGSYYEGLDAVHVAHSESHFYGFNLAGHQATTLRFAVLTWQWKRAIKRALA